MTQISQKTLIALGSNEKSIWGDAAETIKTAVKTVSNLSFSKVEVSTFYKTPAFPAESGPDFINAAMLIDTMQTPSYLLTILHQIEASAGRKRDARWGQRTLDIDLLACDDLVSPDVAIHAHWRNLPADRQIQMAPKELILPHPRMQDRAFVLVPLADVAPDWRHPLLDQTVEEMLAELPQEQVAQVRPLSL